MLSAHWLFQAFFFFSWAAISRTIWLNIGTKSPRVNGSRNGNPELWMLFLSSELEEPDGKLFCLLMEIVSLINYLQLPVNCLPPAPVMPSGNHQSLAINSLLLSSAGRLGSWFANQSIRQPLLLLLSGLAVRNTAWLWLKAILLHGALHIYPLVMKSWLWTQLKWGKQGLDPSPFPDRIISAWDCPRCLGNVLLCSHSRVILNSHFMQFERSR